MSYVKTILGLRVRYVIGLSAIAILVTASFFSMQQVISKQRFHATLVNLASHQAGLCNRIAYFVTQMAAAVDEDEYYIAKSQVGRTVNKMRNAHQILREGSIEQNIPLVTNETLMAIYDDPMVGLDSAVNNYLTRADEIYNFDRSEFSVKSAPYIYLTTYGPHVLEPLLDAAVDEYEIIGKASILRIERLEQGIWIATLVALLLEVLFIFMPLEGNVRKTLRSLEKTIGELRQTRKRLLSAQKLALVGDWELSATTDIMTWSQQVYEILGIENTSEEITWESFLEFVHPDDRRIVNEIFENIIESNRSSKKEFRMIRPDGTELLVYQYATRKLGDSNNGLSFAGTIQDITERKELSTRLEKLSEHVPGFIFECHKNLEGKYKYPYCSKGIVSTCGILPEDVTADSDNLFSIVHEEDLERLKFSLMESAQKLQTWHAKYRVMHPEKGEVWLEGHATPGRMVDGSVLWYGYIWDITERKLSEDQIHKLALYDPLTGLANRRLMRDRLSHNLATSERNGTWGGLIMLDLDNFKNLNDTKGHEMGDELLIEVAKRLNSHTRENDTVARLGGDEFVVILEDVAKTKEQGCQIALEVAEKIRSALSFAYYLDSGKVAHHGSSSVGVTTYQGKRESVSTLLKQADVAMYEAKESGRNRVCLFSEKRQEEINRKNALVVDLQTALKKNEFSLFLQPQVDGKGELKGAEVLLRWFPENKQPVSPAVFIPVAESCDLILPIGEWVIREACQHLKLLMKQGAPEDFSIAVNISVRQFSDELFHQKIQNIITEKGVKPTQLRFEITESCLVKDFHFVNETLLKLQEMGIKIELDDFGTGYSSLNSLHHLPINALKIDRSLVSNIASAHPTDAIIKAIIAMGKAMDIRVIAEGVENDEQRIFLYDEGCDMQQGFYYSKGVPLDDFFPLIQNTGKVLESEFTPEPIYEAAYVTC